MITESLGSELEKDYHHKNDLVLNQFTKIKLSDALIRVYGTKVDSLNNIRINNSTKGFIWVDEKNSFPVAVVNVEDKDDTNWIQTFEVFGPYKGKGLSNQLLMVAIRELKATNISLNKNNSLAIKACKAAHFSEYKSTETSVYMSLDKSTDDESIDESLKSFKNPARAAKMRMSIKKNTQSKLGDYSGDNNPTPPVPKNNVNNKPKKDTDSDDTELVDEGAYRYAQKTVFLRMCWTRLKKPLKKYGYEPCNNRTFDLVTKKGVRQNVNRKIFKSDRYTNSNSIKIYELKDPTLDNKQKVKECLKKFLPDMNDPNPITLSAQYRLDVKGDGIYLYAYKKDVVDKNLEKIYNIYHKNESSYIISISAAAEKAKSILRKEISVYDKYISAFEDIMVPLSDNDNGYTIIKWNDNNIPPYKVEELYSYITKIYDHCSILVRDICPGYELRKDMISQCFYIERV